MRRAVRDYRFEVGHNLFCMRCVDGKPQVSESRMSEECAQYLVQLQKDWERRRVKLGVEALRREVSRADCLNPKPQLLPFTDSAPP